MGRKATWLFSDLSLYDDRELDSFFKEFFAFVFRSELSAPKRPLILVNFSHIAFSAAPIDENGVMLIHSYEYLRYQINHGRDLCVIPWDRVMPDKDRELFISGFTAYALKNSIEIRRGVLSSKGINPVDICNDYFPAVAWLKENRDSEDYDYIFGKLYDYVIARNCLDDLLAYYDGLNDMEGKAEFLNYCGRRGQVEQVKIRL